MNLLIFPHQLFAAHPGLELKPSRVVLIEDSLFFGDAEYPLNFHKQKLWLHRATMKRYELWLQAQGIETLYLDYQPTAGSLRSHLQTLLSSLGSTPKTCAVAEPTDFMLEKRLTRICKQLKLACQFLPTPAFINQTQENQQYTRGKKRLLMADFYKFQRKRLDILMDGDQPQGGKWSFDEDNRKKIPKTMLGRVPPLPELARDQVDFEAKEYVQRLFPHNPGRLDQLVYPTSHAAAEQWLQRFLGDRFEQFGEYEDALAVGESWLWHSVLTPSLNIGLLTPNQVVKETLAFASQHNVPLNSLEGFLRQIVGWREFMRAMYHEHGVHMRTNNHWNHHRKIPDSFYDGTTGIPPIDDTIRRVINTGYCHHIERLMVLGGFMFLCEFDPHDIYGWFMEMFVDSYDWVMVPNAYAMSQHADGGLITTKPYFCGSAYIRKMSNHPAGAWCEIWDGLYWRWIWNHADELSKNPRWAMMCSLVKKMDSAKLDLHLKRAERYMSAHRLSD